MLNSIIKAIRGHNVIKFMYVSEITGKTTYRVVNPYTLGQTSKNNTAVRGFDTKENKFRLFLISNMSSVTVTQEVFTPKFTVYNDKGLHDIQSRITLKSKGVNGKDIKSKLVKNVLSKSLRR